MNYMKNVRVGVLLLTRIFVKEYILSERSLLS